MKDCKNIVERVHYNIFHSGIDGIDAVEAYIKLSNRTNRNFKQIFSYRNFWSHENTTDSSPRTTRSGNPGYLVGKPVLSGGLLTSPTGESYIDDLVEPGRKLSLFTPGPGGVCDFNAGALRSPILFGENIKLGCTVNLNRTEISRSCAALKKQSFQMMNGVPFQQIDETYVATFGDSNPNKTGDWVKVNV